MDRNNIYTYLRYGKRGGEVDKEVPLQVADGDLSGVHDQLATAENPRTRGDEGGAELHKHVEEEEAVRDGANEGDCDAQVAVRGQAGWATDGGEEEIERVYEEGDDAGDEEDVVPVGYDVAVGREDLVAP